MHNDMVSLLARQVVKKESKLVEDEILAYFKYIGMDLYNTPVHEMMKIKNYHFKVSNNDYLRSKLRIFCLDEQELFRFTTKSSDEDFKFTFSVERLYTK